MTEIPADLLLTEADRIARTDGYLSILSMPRDKRATYTRAAKAVIIERSRCADAVEAWSCKGKFAAEFSVIRGVIAAAIRKGEA